MAFGNQVSRDFGVNELVGKIKADQKRQLLQGAAFREVPQHAALQGFVRLDVVAAPGAFLEAAIAPGTLRYRLLLIRWRAGTAAC